MICLISRCISRHEADLTVSFGTFISRSIEKDEINMVTKFELFNDCGM